MADNEQAASGQEFVDESQQSTDQNSQQDVTSESSAESKTQDTATGGEQKPDSPEQAQGEEFRFDKHPRFQQITRQNREMRDQLRQSQELIQQLQGSVSTLQTGFGNFNKPQQPPVDPEQQQAINLLREKLGLPDVSSLTERLDKLEKENQNMTKAQIDRQFDEEQSRIEKVVQDKALGQTEEVLDKIEEFIDKNQFLAANKSKPGVFETALHVMMAQGQFGDMGKLAAQKELAEQQAKAKAGLTESPSTAKDRASKQLGRNDSTETFTANLIKSLGGEVDMA